MQEKVVMAAEAEAAAAPRVETKLRKIKVGESYFTTVFRYSKRYDTLRNTLMLTREKFTVQCVPK